MTADMLALRSTDVCLARRIEAHMPDPFTAPDSAFGVGEFDGVIDCDGTARRAVFALSRRLREQLAFGAMPEPHCTLCRTLVRDQLLGVRLHHAVLDYHDEPFRTAKRKWQGGPEVYRRCCIIYEAARESLEVETQVAA